MKRLLTAVISTGLVLGALSQVDCSNKSKKTYAMAVSPCYTGFNIVDAGHDATKQQDSGVPVANDPNNCGQCGTLCGTYVNNGAGYSEQQGVCIGVNCNTPTPTNNAPVVIATTTTDCIDNYGPGWVVNTQDGAPRWNSANANYPEAGSGQCVNICTDSYNCGKLGNKCPGGQFCQFCQCH
jgi:hypothetical protein